MFDRTTLPIGSVIEIKSGFQYRPDGWSSINPSTRPGSRPGNVTQETILVDEAWWGDYNYRGFNISSTTLDSLASVLNEAKASFKIYIPKK